jgi:iron complex transport system ATP-binding protein
MQGLALHCAALACGYHGRPVLAGIEFEFRFGESIALLGPNGAGKSTLLKTICGELKPLSGGVFVGTRESDRMRNVGILNPSEIARMIAIVPQEEPSPFPFLVREVVTLGRLAFGSGIFDSREDLEAAEKAMILAECDHLANRPITELSGGERQRVLIARALAQNTGILLMDEPTSHLDPPHQASIGSLCSKLAEGGKCMITAVHDLNLASTLAGRAILISDGKILLDGPVERVLEDTRLEDCYHTNFERVRTSSGRLLVIAKGD